jgi:general secretion pathway protein K
MFRILKNNRGMALLITILVISLLLVMTLRFNTAIRANLTSASNLQHNIALDYMARSAFNAARAALAVDAAESGYDTLHEDWANLAVASEYFSYFFSQGQGSMNIIDHSGKLQINSLLTNTDANGVVIEQEGKAVNEEQKQMWINFLSSEEFGLAEGEPANIVEAIIDWIDADDEPTGFGGAESSYYQGLPTPYLPRNGPMEFVEELLLVKGISRELFYGTDEKPGIVNLVTPYGKDGKININTADPLVLGALSEQMEPDMVDAMLSYREDPDNDLGSPEWYRSAPGFPGDVVIPPKFLTTSSSYFEITTEVVLEKMRRKVDGLILRGPGSKTKLVFWKVD